MTTALLFALALAGQGANGPAADIPVFTQPEPHLEAGAQAMANRSFDKAIEHYRRANAKTAKERAVVEYNVGIAALEKAQNLAMMEAVKKVQMGAGAPDPDETLNDDIAATPDYDAATDALERAFKLADDPKVRSQAALGAGNAYALQENLKKAVESYRRALVEDAGNQAALKNLRTSLIRMRRKDSEPEGGESGDEETPSGDDEDGEESEDGEEKDGDDSSDDKEQNGDQEDGDQQDGDQQEGDQQDGDQQDGDQQDGDQQDGDQKDGDQNDGDQNDGNQQDGDQKDGDQKPGDQKDGNQKDGDEDTKKDSSEPKSGDDKKQDADDEKNDGDKGSKGQKEKDGKDKKDQDKKDEGKKSGKDDDKKGKKPPEPDPLDPKGGTDKAKPPGSEKANAGGGKKAKPQAESPEKQRARALLDAMRRREKPMGSVLMKPQAQPRRTVEKDW